MRLRMDWRPVVGLAPEDAGGLTERVMTRAVLELVLELHNADVRRAEKSK